MTASGAAALVAALGLPAEARVEQRVPKKLLLEHGAPTAADKRQISTGIERITWEAALKPNTVGVPAYGDASREYGEIAVLSLALRDGAKASRLIELLHRAIPYPAALCVEQEGAVSLSLAHKRRSLGEAEAVVVEEVRRSPAFDVDAPTPEAVAFLHSLPLAGLGAQNLYALYTAWLERVVALEAASLTGAFSLPASPERAEARRAALAEYTRLQREAATLRAQAARETQMSRRVELNLALKRIATQLATITQAL